MQTRHFITKEYPFAFTNGVQACWLEVDVDTGMVKLLKHWCVEDCGRIINPLLVDEQVRGGIVQGIGGALYEHCIYSPEGQLLIGSMADYLVPMSAEMPDIEVGHVETPTKESLLGAKGAGEAGTAGAPAAIMNAINDALKPFNAKVFAQPFTPERILAALGKVPARWPEVSPLQLRAAAGLPRSLLSQAGCRQCGGKTDASPASRPYVRAAGRAQRPTAALRRVAGKKHATHPKLGDALPLIAPCVPLGPLRVPACRETPSAVPRPPCPGPDSQPARSHTLQGAARRSGHARPCHRPAACISLRRRARAIRRRPRRHRPISPCSTAPA